jgi:hypothetical protein
MYVTTRISSSIEVTISLSESLVLIHAGGTDLRDVPSSGGTLNARSYPFIAWNGGDAEWTTVRHMLIISPTKNRQSKMSYRKAIVNSVVIETIRNRKPAELCVY